MIKLVFLMKHDKLPGPIINVFKKIGNKGVEIKSIDITLETKIPQTYSPITVYFSIKVIYVEVCQHFRNYKMEQRMQKI